MESSQLEKGKGLKKLCLMALQASLQILQLRQVREGNEEIPAEVSFTREEIEFAQKVYDNELKGSTRLQENLHQVDSLAWMSWIISRLGGWKGYVSIGMPGPIILKELRFVKNQA